MVRVKGGIVTKRRHNKILDLAKGYWMSRSKQYRKAKEAVLHAGEYAFAGRKHKKRDFRTQWIVRINSALKENDMKYSEFIHQMNEKKVTVDRKILAQLALDYPKVFQAFVSKIKG
ncbi:MAG TPA: 50S ribosomal protein L20 [Candidatus Woesebacteria bacterium]|nr:50S ribosomal protein L20 [Candidatus Woesebacteria bacterium]